MSRRRSSARIDLASVDVAEQERELARLLQEKEDHDFAVQVMIIEMSQGRRFRPRPTYGSPPPGGMSAPGAIRRPVPRYRPPTPARPTNRTPSSYRSQVVTISSSEEEEEEENTDNIRSYNEPEGWADVPDNNEDEDEDEDEDEVDDEEDESAEEEEDDDDDDPPNRITQPFQGDDANMYRRELELERDFDNQPSTSASAAAAYNPPPRVGVPVSKWGDCSMCFEAPIEPRGCNGCYQILGCKTCVTSWFTSSVAPSCPLCRRKWINEPDVSAMTTIDRRRRLRARDRKSRSARS